MINRNTRLGIKKVAKKRFREYFQDTNNEYFNEWYDLEFDICSGLKEFLEHALTHSIKDYEDFTTDNLNEAQKVSGIANIIFTEHLNKLVESFENLKCLNKKLSHRSEPKPLFIIGGGVAFDEYSGWSSIGKILSEDILKEDFEEIMEKLIEPSKRVNLFNRVIRESKRNISELNKKLKGDLLEKNDKVSEHKILSELIRNKDLEHIVFFSLNNLPDCYNSFIIYNEKKPLPNNKVPLIILMRGCLNKNPIYPHININLNKDFIDLIKSSFRENTILIALDGSDPSFDIKYIDNIFSDFINDNFYSIVPSFELEKSSEKCKHIYTSPSFALRYLFPDYYSTGISFRRLS